MHAKVEHPFRVIKRQFGLMKVRFRGLQKNTAPLLTLFALFQPVDDATTTHGSSPSEGDLRAANTAETSC